MGSRYLRNLTSQQLDKDVAPWDFVPVTPIPDNVRKDKKARDSWINAPSTVHHVYTLCEGINPNLRISKLRTDGGGNPIHCEYALVADYDSPQPEEKVLAYAKSLPYPPNYIERTLSGNWRFVWLLEKPLIYASDGLARHFKKTFADFAFDPSQGCPGFDKSAWQAPERLWTNGCDWRHLHDNKIPADVTQGWLVKASQSYKFTPKEFGNAIPLDVVKSELEKRYPAIATWPGEFAVGEQGPTFWVPESTSPKSAIIRETGIQTFSDHAAKGFYSWADLLGAAFVKEYEAASIGRAVEDIHYDGRHYWIRVADGSYQHFERGDMQNLLRIQRGLSPKSDKGGTNEVDRATLYIQTDQRVTSAGPFIYQPEGVIVRHGKRYLNTSNVRVLAPAEGKAVWGPKGQFPFVSQLLNLIDTPEAFAAVRAWGAWAYQHAYRLEPTSGQALILAGGVGVGKTLLNRAVFGVLFGGFAEAGSFFTGKDNFNSDILEKPYWVQDDGSVGVGALERRYYSEIIKKVVANGELRVNEKFRKAGLAEWKGRIGITLNDDEESLMQIPDLGISNLEKIILAHCVKVPGLVFPSQAEIKKILDRELPWFARWLLDYEIEAHLLGESRFGVRSFADSRLLDTSRQSSPNAGFSEILEDWKTQFFTVLEPKKEYWEGTAFQLQKQILLDPTAEAAMRRFGVAEVGKHLMGLKAKGHRLEVCSTNGTRVWRIYRDQISNQTSTKK